VLGACRAEKGVPFASPNALFNFPKLSVRWLSLHVAVKRIADGRVLKRKSS
jgi:putative transposase